MVVNGYEIKSEIYRGPVTTVYDANHMALGRRVLLKVLNPQWTKEVDLIERFRREAKICARLDHPNIVKIFDFSTSTESNFISMEYVEGSTLEMLIQQNKIKDFTEIIRITIQTLTGLSYAHDQGVIHRDIKPSNIMISNHGEVKITDFGLAVVSDLPGITGQNQTVGSPAYMSPEQALGKELDYRTDLFSLGVSLYKACTQIAPFEADNIGSTIQNILTREVKSVNSVKNIIPIWYSNLIDSFIAKEVQDRPDSAAIALSIINNFSNTEDIRQQDKQNHTSQQVRDTTIRSSLFKVLNPNFQTHIFLWAVPVILILIYLLFRPTEERKIEQTEQQKNISQMQGILVPDSIISNHAQATFTDKNIINKNSFPNDKSIAASINRIVTKNIYTPDTTSDSTAIKKGKLFIIAKPWADVYIDSIYYEATPLTKSISLAPGLHLVELRNPNYRTFSKHYYLQEAQPETLVADLELNVGFLNIRVLPWAKIYINGQYLDTTPVEKPIRIAAGEHVITLTYPNYESIIDTIEVISGKILDKRFKFVK